MHINAKITTDTKIVQKRFLVSTPIFGLLQPSQSPIILQNDVIRRSAHDLPGCILPDLVMNKHEYLFHCAMSSSRRVSRLHELAIGHTQTDDLLKYHHIARVALWRLNE